MKLFEVPDRSRTIVGLHYVRALATIMVVVVHACLIVALPKYYGSEVLAGFFDPGAGEIDLFFLMSGVIMVIATHSATTLRPRSGVGDFLRRRAIRIVPMLWLAVLAFNLIYLVGRGETVDPMESLRALVFWPVGSVVPFVAWTIRYEVLFYLIFALCFIARPKLMPLAVLWFVSPLLISLVAQPPKAEDGTFLHFFFSPFNMEFGAGVALGFAYLRRGAARPFRHQLLAIVVVLAAMRTAVWWAGPSAVFASTPFVLALLPAGIVVVLLALKTDPIRAFRPLIFIGDASYSIFLFHPHVVSPVVQVLARVAPSLPPGLAAAVATLAAIGVGSLIHVLIEKPLVRVANMRFHTLPKAIRAPG